MRFRIYCKKEKKYVSENIGQYYINHEGKLYFIYAGDGEHNELHKALDPDRYIVEYCLLKIDGKEMFEGDIISVNGKHPKILGVDDFGFYLENVEDVKHRSWMETKQRPSPIWFKEFSREFEIIGTIHDGEENGKE